MLKGALIGCGVALLMLLPPIIHFVSGPLGPLVGGFFGGARARASLVEAIGVGFFMSVFMAAPIAGLVILGSAIELPLPESVRNVLVYVGIVVVVYTGFMGTIGAVIGGHSARLAASQESSTGPA